MKPDFVLGFESEERRKQDYKSGSGNSEPNFISSKYTAAKLFKSEVNFGLK